MRVAGVQLDIAWEDVAANLEAARERIARAASGGARVIVLPEMFATGFTMDASAAAAAHDRTRAAITAAAEEHSVWIMAGLVEPATPRPFNLCLVAAPDGAEALRYRKIHPFSLAGEHEHYAGGEALETLDVEGVRVTPLICYDLRFPEPFRIAATDTDVFCVIANWPAKRGHAWRALLRARAIENQCFVVGVNRCGDGDGHHYSGDSAIVDPLGEELASASEDEALVCADVSADRVAEVRRRFGFLDDRRPDTYQRIKRVRSE